MQSRLPLARAFFALALFTFPVAAQECVDDYIAQRSGIALLHGCPAPECPFPQVDFHVVEGGGSELQQTILVLGTYTPGPYTIIEVGPPIRPSVPEVYDPIQIDASAFPSGLAIIARWGPTLTVIEGSPGVPCVEVIGGLNDGPIRIGAADRHLVLGLPPPAEDYDGWYGFQIRGGVPDLLIPTLPDGGGIVLRSVDSEVDIAGNLIQGNRRRNSGGGIFAELCDQLWISLNHVQLNSVAEYCEYEPLVPVRGAGIHHRGGSIQLLGNRVESNRFGVDLCTPLPDEPARQGGGVAVEVFDDGFHAHYSCGNEIFENEASEGNGYWIDAVASVIAVPVRLELNELRANSTWEPIITAPTSIEGAFRGGGIWVRGRSLQLVKPAVDRTLQIEIVSNRVSENIVANPGLIPALPNEPDDVGGGIYSDVERNDRTDVVAIVGNAIWVNEAPRLAGGMWVDHPSTSVQVAWGELHHNTIAFNRITAPTGRGAGIYIAAASRFDGSSSVIWGNEVGGVPGVLDGNWFAEPTVVDQFRFSHMPLNPGGASVNLFGPACDFDDPGLVGDDWHLIDDNSECVDSADPNAGILMDIAQLGLFFDPEGGPRVIDRIAPFTPTAVDDRDRGADERLNFLRGDANGDGLVNAADPVYILSYLFQGGPTSLCMKAADVNDDGAVDITDPTSLLEYLFGNPPPLPPDLNVCGVLDPTQDTLAMGPGTPCVP